LSWSVVLPQCTNGYYSLFLLVSGQCLGVVTPYTGGMLDIDIMEDVRHQIEALESEMKEKGKRQP